MADCLSPERPSITHKFTIRTPERSLKIYMTVGLYEDGLPAELFLKCGDAGALERGLLHSVAVMASLAIRHGCPWEKVAHKLRGMSFEPAGVTGGERVPMCSSVSDYIGKWLISRFKEKSDELSER